MGQALYRKYRSRGWDELVGQEHVSKTLQNAVKSGKFGHAYLFSGPRGVGKTSAARILARQINGLNYIKDEPHIDIIEIDAASNTSVEDIRDLREKVSVAPTLARYKIYIIDEVHMLSKSAFNALLKTLEEPPAHVIFILATTDPQKLPETIISRTQHFAFQPIANELATKQLLAIAKSEKIKLEPDAANLIAELGEGSFRDSISLLDQLAASGQTITRELVENLAGLPPEQLIHELALAVDNHEARQVVKLLESARTSGYQAAALAKQLGQHWREEALKLTNSDKLALVRQLLAVQSSPKPDQLLEIILLEVSLASGAAEKVSARRNDSEHGGVGVSSDEAHENTSHPASAPKPQTKTPRSQPPANSSNTSELWASVLEQIRPKYHTLYAMARMATPTLAGNKLTLEFPFPFHLKRVSEAKNQQIILNAASELAGRELTLNCQLNPKLASDEPTLAATSEPTVDPPMKAPVENVEQKDVEPDQLATISNIFGDAELLQSD